jgi:hypothetical protein
MLKDVQVAPKKRGRKSKKELELAAQQAKGEQNITVLIEDSPTSLEVKGEQIEYCYSKIKYFAKSTFIIMMPNLKNFLLLFVSKLHNIKNNLNQINLDRTIISSEVTNENILQIMNIH